MGVIPDRKEFKNFTYENYIRFADSVEQLGFTLVTHTPYTKTSHYDKFGFLYEGKKVVVVYDTKAKMLTLTCQSAAMKKISPVAKQLCAPSTASDASDGKKDKGKAVEGKAPAEKSQSGKKNEPKGGAKQKYEKKNKNKESAAQSDKKQPPAKQSKQTEKPAQASKQLDRETDLKQKDKSGKRDRSDKDKHDQTRSDTVVIGGIYQLSFRKALHKIRNNSELRINTLKTRNFGKVNEENNYTVIRADKECALRYMPSVGQLDVSGEIAGQIADVFLSLGGTKVSSTVKEEKREVKEEKSRYTAILKKYLPTALEYLSVSAQNNLGSGFDEINKASDHYEYSMFLLAPFKGLENFIFELQRAKDIEVKLIGQAYDKDERGRYILKSAYTKKVGVVYSEVLAALYTEYYEKRNFYMHSTAADSHKIGSKEEAKEIIVKLFSVIEYNCKKLKEIGFSL